MFEIQFSWHADNADNINHVIFSRMNKLNAFSIQHLSTLCDILGLYKNGL